jgi:sodium transport system permease protein
VAIAVGQLGLVVIPFVAMRITDRSIQALGLRRVPSRFVIAGMLVGVSAWYINMRVVELIDFDETRTTGLAQLVERPTLGVVLIAIALAPAVCEEVLFRGVLARGLATRFHPWAAIVASSVLFSVYHLNPVQMLPTFTLGIVLGTIALRAGSAIPTMIAHLLNNAMALIVARDEVPGLASWLENHPTIALAGAIALTAIGIVMTLVGSAADPLPSSFPRATARPRGSL